MGSACQKIRGRADKEFRARRFPLGLQMLRNSISDILDIQIIQFTRHNRISSLWLIICSHYPRDAAVPLWAWATRAGSGVLLLAVVMTAGLVMARFSGAIFDVADCAKRQTPSPIAVPILSPAIAPTVVVAPAAKNPIPPVK
jgi:hypothetical protein